MAFIKNPILILISLYCAVALGQQFGGATFTTGWGDEFYLEEPEDKTILKRETVEEIISFNTKIVRTLKSKDNIEYSIWVDDDLKNILDEKNALNNMGRLIKDYVDTKPILEWSLEAQDALQAFQKVENELNNKEAPNILVIKKSQVQSILQRYKILDEAGLYLGDPGLFDITNNLDEIERVVLSELNSKRTLIRKPYRDMPLTQGFVIRRVLYEILEISLTTEPDQVPEEMRKVLSKYGQFWEILSENNDVDSLLKTAGLPNPNSESVAKMLLESLLKQPIVSENLRSFAGKRPLLRSDFNSSKQVEKRLDVLKHVPNVVFHQVSKEIRQNIQDLDLSGHEAISTLTKMNGFKDGNELSKIMQITLTQYFSKLSFEDKSRLAIAYMKLEPTASLEQQIAAALQATGPFVQKLFQLIGDEVDSDLIKKATKELKASVAPFPGRLAKIIVEKSLDAPVETVFSKFSETPINAGTIGQIHIAELKSTGEAVVVKVLRPGVREHFERELKIVLSIVEDPSHRKIIEAYAETIVAEMDFRTEAANMANAEFMVRPKQQVTTVRRVSEIPATRDVLVLTKARGKTLDKYPLFHAVPDSVELQLMSDEEVQTLINQFSNIMSIWFSNALFGDGYFHGDIHTGNIMTDVTGDKPIATVIDFGNFQLLTSEQRKAFVKLIAACIRGRADQAALIVGRMGSLPDSTIRELEASLKQSDWKALTVQDKIATTLGYGTRLGAKLPPEFLNFARSKLMLETALDVVNKNLNVLDPKQKRFKPLKANSIFFRGVVKEFTRQLCNKLFRRN